MIHMKHTKLMTMKMTMKLMTIFTMLLLAVSGATAQSLGEAARAARKNKPETTSASHVYDNDNLPTNDGLSVVGPAPTDGKSAGTPKAAAVDPATARQQTADAWKEKLDKQKEKIASLSHELDLDQRELQLHSAALQTDPTISVRDVKFNKDAAQYKSDLDAKQKALDTARQEMNDLQDQAHKAGVAQNDKDSDKDKDNSKDKDDSKDK